MTLMMKNVSNNFIDVINDKAIKKLYKDSEYTDERKTIRKKFLALAKEGFADKEFVRSLWLEERIKGLPNCSQGSFVSRGEYPEVEKKLVKILEIIAKGKNTEESYIKCLNALEKLKSEDDILRIPYAMLHRAFIGFYPDQHVDWVAKSIIKIELECFSLYHDININLDGVNKKNKWFLISTRLRAAANSLAKNVDPDYVRYAVSYVIKAYRDHTDDIVSHTSGLLATTRTYTAGEVDVWLNEVGKLQPKFLDWLQNNRYEFKVQFDAKSGGVCDVYAEKNNQKYIFELKHFSDAGLDESIKIRMAIGQLLEYGVWDGSVKYDGLCLVTNKRPTPSNCKFLKNLITKYNFGFNCLYLDRNGQFVPLIKPF